MVSEGGRMEARMGKSAPSCPCLLSHSQMTTPFPRRRMSRVVHLFICRQSGLAPECVLFSLLPLSCSSCLPEKFFRLVQVFGFYSVGLYFCPLHCVGFLWIEWRLGWPSVTVSLRSRDHHAEHCWLLATCSCDRGWVSEQSWRHELAWWGEKVGCTVLQLMLANVIALQAIILASVMASRDLLHASVSQSHFCFPITQPLRLLTSY